MLVRLLACRCPPNGRPKGIGKTMGYFHDMQPHRHNEKGLVTLDVASRTLLVYHSMHSFTKDDAPLKTHALSEGTTIRLREHHTARAQAAVEVALPQGETLCLAPESIGDDLKLIKALEAIPGVVHKSDEISQQEAVVIPEPTPAPPVTRCCVIA